MQLRTTSGDKLTFEGLSLNKGVVWVLTDLDWRTHILIADLDEESQLKVNNLLAEASKK